jgi:excisionase family DNA binding protein
MFGTLTTLEMYGIIKRTHRQVLLMTEEKMLTVKEVCSRLRVSHTTVVRLIESGEIKNVIKVGTQYRIPEGSFNEYLKKASL